jgi:hypothetical protein
MPHTHPRKKERGKGNQNNVEEDKRKRREKERNPQKKLLFPACTAQNALPFPALTPPTIKRWSTPLFIGTAFHTSDKRKSAYRIDAYN